MIAQYSKCFNGIGKFQGEYHVTVDLKVLSLIHAPWCMQINLKDDIQNELDDVATNGTITKIEEGEPTPWVNGLVYWRKQNGRLRLYLDRKDLNTAIQREQHVTPMQRSHAVFHFHSRRDPTKVDLSYSLLHGWCKVCFG